MPVVLKFITAQTKPDPHMKKLFLLFFLSFSVCYSIAAPLQPIRLTCEYLENPLGIDSATPRLSWLLSSIEQNQTQSAVEILVSDNMKDVLSAKGNLWQSGKIKSSQNFVDYSSTPLSSFKKYYWRIRVYNGKDEVSEWSSAAQFETSMLSSTDWTAQWIGDGSKQFEKDEDFYQDDRMPLFRRTFSSSKKIESARLYVSGLGYYEAFLNGKRIGDRVLDPGWTSYNKEVLYSAYDVTPAIKNGNNVIGVMLGNGWYNPLPIKLFGRFNLRDVQQTGRPALKAEIHLRYADGTVQKIITDESWTTAPGPVIRNNTYLGEHYDARLEQPDWLSASVDEKNWRKASVTEGPSGVLSSQRQPPIRITKTLKAVSVQEISPGVFIADMGQNFAGVARIKVKGPAGTRIKLRYGEALMPDGTLNYLTTVAGQIKEIWKLKGGPGAPATAWQEDDYILKGSGTEVWAPRFTFHGFRFVEITGWPGKPDVNSIEGLRMNSDLTPAGEFSCSNDMFNQLHTVAQWTFLSNVFSVQSDCPGREKMGYGADIVVTANTFMYNFDMTNFYRKTLRDYANDQQPDGGITEIAPYTGIADRGYGGHSGPLGWQLAFPYLQDQLYEFYGDVRPIRDYYPAFQKQMDFLQSHADQGLYHWDISDHEAIDPKPEALSAAAFYYHHAFLAAKFAGILQKKEDSVKYGRLAAKIKSDIVRKYLVPGTGRFDNATQSAQLFALWYNLSPEKDKTFDVLMQEFKRHHDHVSSGIFGVKFMFDVLREQNQNEEAYKIASQPDYPGWGYMLGKGATTLWEDWKYPDNGPSQNHPMFGSVDEWFYRSLLGINPCMPGFKKIIIKPQPPAGMTWAKGSYQTVNGKAESSWTLHNGKYELLVVIPVNTTAEVWVKSKDASSVTEAGKSVTDGTYRDGYVVIKKGSGSYKFESTL